MEKQEILAGGEACKAIFWPTPGLQDRMFDSSGFSAEGTSISVQQYPITDDQKESVWIAQYAVLPCWW